MNNSNDGSIEIDNRAMPRTEHDLILEREREKFNTYATSKSVSQELLNTSTIQAQIGMIIGLFATRDLNTNLHAFEITLLALVCASLVLQFVIFTLLVILARATDTKIAKSGRCVNVKTTSVNNTVTTLSGLGLILNISITAVALQTS